MAQHRAKVYSQASVGAPPMSVPHLDTRVVDGEASLMFGPFATFSPKFLKNGSMLDIVTQVRPHNILPMLKVAIEHGDKGGRVSISYSSLDQLDLICQKLSGEPI